MPKSRKDYWAKKRCACGSMCQQGEIMCPVCLVEEIDQAAGELEDLEHCQIELIEKLQHCRAIAI